MTTNQFQQLEQKFEALGFEKIYEKQNPYFTNGLFSSEKDKTRVRPIETFQLFYHPTYHILARTSSYTSIEAHQESAAVVANDIEFSYNLKTKASNFFATEFFATDQQFDTFKDSENSIVYHFNSSTSLEQMEKLIKKYKKKNLEFIPLGGTHLNTKISPEYFTDIETYNFLKFGNNLQNALYNPPKNESYENYHKKFLKDILKVKKGVKKVREDWHHFLSQLPPILSKELNYLKTHENHAQADIDAAISAIKLYEHTDNKKSVHKAKKTNMPSPKIDKISDSNFLLEKDSTLYFYQYAFSETHSDYRNTSIRLTKKEKIVAQNFYNALIESAKAQALHLNLERTHTFLDKRTDSEIFHKKFEREAYEHLNFFLAFQLTNHSPKILNYWYTQAQNAEKRKPFLEEALLKPNYMANYRVDIAKELKLSNFQFLFFERLNTENTFIGNMITYFPTQLQNLLYQSPLADIANMQALFKSGDYDINFFVDNIVYLDRKNFKWWGSDKLEDKKIKLQELLNYVSGYIERYSPDLDTPQKIENLIVQLDKKFLEQELCAFVEPNLNVRQKSKIKI